MKERQAQALEASLFLERVSAHHYRLPESIPGWAKPLLSEGELHRSGEGTTLELCEPTSFMGAFASEIEEHWRESNAPLGSGVVTFKQDLGAEVYLELRALTIGSTRVLAVEHIGSSYAEALGAATAGPRALVNLAHRVRHLVFRPREDEGRTPRDLTLDLDPDGVPTALRPPGFLGIDFPATPCADNPLTRLPADLRTQIERHRLKVLEHNQEKDFQYRFPNDHAERGTLYRLLIEPVGDGATRLFALDITSHHEAFARALMAHDTDPVTGLPNRNGMTRRIATAIGRSSVVSKSYCGVLFIDLDGFKEVNDTHGHKIGDLLLVRVAERIADITRSVDMVSRWGGDEFVVLVEGLHSDRDAATVAGKIVHAIAQPIEIEGTQFEVSASVGVAVAPADGEDVDSLLSKADGAMYKAKASGGRRYRLASQVEESLLAHREKVRASLVDALRKKQMTLRLWPQGAATEEVLGFEVVPYWLHPERGPINPALLLRSVSRSRDPLHEVSIWALERTVAMLERADISLASGSGDFICSLALGTETLGTASALEKVIAILERAPDARRRLEFMLPESVLELHDAPVVVGRLRAAGVRLALVLAGSRGLEPEFLANAGFSRFVVHDSLTETVLKEPKARAIAAGLGGVARGLGLEVLARGVDSQKQLEAMADCGCTHFQGCRTGHPLSIEEVLGREAQLAADQLLNDPLPSDSNS